MNKRKSLSFKIALTTVISLGLGLTAGIISTYLVQENLLSNYTNLRLSKTTTENSRALDDSLLRVQATVEQIDLLASNKFYETTDLEDETLIENTLPVLQSVYETSAKATKFACAYWIILNPDYTHTTASAAEGDGFFYVKSGDDFISKPVTNIKKYSPDDKEHIGWWIAINESKKPTWTSPYYNANVNFNMFSYIEPFFSIDNHLLGAVGIDLNLNEIVNSMAGSFGYKDGYGALLDSNNKIIYHRDVVTFDINGHYVGTDLTLDSLTGYSGIADSENNVITYRYGGKSRTASAVTLNNNMKFVISVSTGELRQPLRIMILVPIGIFLAVAVVVLIIIYFVVRKFLNPLSELNEDIKKIEGGDLDAEIKKEHDDEVGDLTDSFKRMMETIRNKNSVISAMAYNDGLTGVKNRNAQEQVVNRINQEINGGVAKFAIVMLDVNKLKLINDELGHTAGDKAIRESCFKLCEEFKHSPVFRIGGDEFIAILENSDYDNRDVIFEKLKLDSYNPETGMNLYSIGMATFNKEVDSSFADVFSRADDEMYKMKNN